MAGVEIKKVKDIDDGIRLNRWFLKYYPGLGIGRLQKLLRTKQIKVDGKKAESGTKLQSGQEIRVPPLENEAADNMSQKGLPARDAAYIQSLVIFKDENIIAINKPSGLAVQGGTNTSRHVDGMLAGLQFEKEEKPKLVHRIDKDTSGILLLARNRRYADLLTKAFREHVLQKTYLALTFGCPKKLNGEVKAPLEKVGEKSIVCDNGKPSVTTYEVCDALGDKFALVKASPLTGRTHQIRAHMEYMGCPIVGDDKYFGKERKKVSGISDKLHLHAYKIDLSAIYNKKLILTAQLPKYFQESLDILGISFKE